MLPPIIGNLLVFVRYYSSGIVSVNDIRSCSGVNGSQHT